MGLFPVACCWFALVRNSTAWRVSRTLATVFVSGIIAELKLTCVWNDSTSFKVNNLPLTCSSECSLASVPPASASHDCDCLALQEECTANCAESYEAKSSATTLIPQVCHFDGYTNAATGLQFTSCVTTTLSQCCASTLAQTEKFDALDCLHDGLRYWLRACFGRQSWSAHVCQPERERCLSNYVPACLPGVSGVT